MKETRQPPFPPHPKYFKLRIVAQKEKVFGDGLRRELSA